MDFSQSNPHGTIEIGVQVYIDPATADSRRLRMCEGELGSMSLDVFIEANIRSARLMPVIVGERLLVGVDFGHPTMNCCIVMMRETLAMERVIKGFFNPGLDGMIRGELFPEDYITENGFTPWRREGETLRGLEILDRIDITETSGVAWFIDRLVFLPPYISVFAASPEANRWTVDLIAGIHPAGRVEIFPMQYTVNSRVMSGVEAGEDIRLLLVSVHGVALEDFRAQVEMNDNAGFSMRNLYNINPGGQGARVVPFGAMQYSRSRVMHINRVGGNSLKMAIISGLFQ